MSFFDNFANSPEAVVAGLLYRLAWGADEIAYGLSAGTTSDAELRGYIEELRQVRTALLAYRDERAALTAEGRR